MTDASNLVARRERESVAWAETNREEGGGSRSSSAGHDMLATLYGLHAPRLVRSLARRKLSPDDAWDVVQIIFTRLLGSSNPATITRPDFYLERAAANAVRDDARAAARRRADLHVSAEAIELRGPDPHDQLEARDTLRRLEAALLKLKPKTRQIFMAHRFDDMSYAEIAERTGMSVKGVEKQMSKALVQIDRMLDRR